MKQVLIAIYLRIAIVILVVASFGSSNRTILAEIDYLQFADVPLRAVAWHPEGSLLAASSTEQVWIYKISNEQTTQLNIDEGFTALKLEWSQDGAYLAASASDSISDNRIYIWETASFQLVTKIEQTWPDVGDITWNPNAHQLAIAYFNEIRIWDIDNNTIVMSLIGHEKPHSVTTIAWSPNGNYIASGSNDRTVRIWKVDKFQTSKILTLENPAPQLAWKFDSSQLAITENNRVKIWNIDSYQTTVTLTEHEDLIVSLDWKANILATSSIGINDTTVRFWDSNNWKYLGVFSENNVRGTRKALSISSDGSYLAFAGVNGYLTIRPIN